MFTDSTIIFFNNKNFKRKRNVSFQKCEYFYEFTLDVFFCPEFIFCTKSWLHSGCNDCLLCCSQLKRPLIKICIFKDGIRSKTHSFTLSPPKKIKLAQNRFTCKGWFLLFQYNGFYRDLFHEKMKGSKI